MPIELQTAAQLPKPETRGLRLALPSRGGAIGGKERIFFTERLALLLETGNPLHVSLGTLGRQALRPRMREVIEDLGEGVAGGLSFSQALAKHPDVFPSTYCNLVAAGEQGGFLPKVLQRLREMDERREELRSTLFAAFSYPAFLVVFSVAVLVFVLVVVFPKFGELFTLIHDQLPVTTRWLMAMSDGLRNYWAPGLAAMAGVALLVWRWLRGAEGMAAADRLLLRLPVIRDISIQLRLVQFLHVMSLSLGNGVAMLDALRSCREVVWSPSFQRFVDGLETHVNEGRGIAVGFRDADFLPDLAQQMISTGEETGSLAVVMGRVAEFYERQWRQKLLTVAKIVEPAMLLVMGVVVGLIVSSLILPIFKLSTAVR